MGRTRRSPKPNTNIHMNRVERPSVTVLMASGLTTPTTTQGSERYGNPAKVPIYGWLQLNLAFKTLQSACWPLCAIKRYVDIAIHPVDQQLFADDPMAGHSTPTPAPSESPSDEPISTVSASPDVGKTGINKDSDVPLAKRRTWKHNLDCIKILDITYLCRLGDGRSRRDRPGRHILRVWIGYGVEGWRDDLFHVY